MTSVIQPTGVYQNLYRNPLVACPSAQAPAAAPVQPTVQQAPQTQAPTQPSLPDAQNAAPKKKSHKVMFGVLALCAVAAGVLIGVPALGKYLDTIKAKKIIEKAPFNFLKPPLRAAREAIVSFGKTIDNAVDNFCEKARSTFDYRAKWKAVKKADAEPKIPD